MTPYLQAHCWSFLFILLKFIIIRMVGEPVWDAGFKVRHEQLRAELDKVLR